MLWAIDMLGEEVAAFLVSQRLAEALPPVPKSIATGADEAHNGHIIEDATHEACLAPEKTQLKRLYSF